MKKLLAAVTVLIAAVSVCIFFQNAPPLSLSDIPPTSPTKPIDLQPPLAITLTQNRHYRALLPSTLQSHYDTIVETLLEHSGTDTASSDGEPAFVMEYNTPQFDVDEAQLLCEAVYNDHPEFFYLTGRSTISGVQDRCVSITMYYSMTLKERTAAYSELEDVVCELTATCYNMTDFEKELYLHDALLARCRYDQVAADSNDTALRDKTASPYGALCEGNAICGGYTRAMQLLLDRVGIESTMVYGGDHTWNMVFLDGHAYHLDATWDDTSENIVLHHYFNVTTDEILQSHQIEGASLLLPVAAHTDENYYIKNNRYIVHMPSKNFTKLFASQLSSEIVEVRFSADMYDTALAYIQSDDFYEVFDGIDADTREAWYVFTYLQCDDVCAITFSAKDD